MVDPAKGTSKLDSSPCKDPDWTQLTPSSPKSGDANTDQVRLRGESKLVNAIKAEIEKQVKLLKETIVVGVVVPASQHATKIGRGGSALHDLQRKTNTT